MGQLMHCHRNRTEIETKLKVARALMADHQLSMAEIARQIGCAPSTLFRSIPGGRGAMASFVVGPSA
jgi:transposase-like protein